MARRLAWLLLLTACVRSRAVELPDLEPGDLVVVAPATADARPTPLGGAAFLYQGPSDQAALAVPESAPFFVFRFPHGSLLGADGQPVSPELVSGLQVHGTDVAPSDEGCGRCLVPSNTAPQLVNPGDACAIPGFAEARLFVREGDGFVEDSGATAGETLALARARLRLDWPGACACAGSTSPLTLSDADLRPISPVGAEYRFTAFAQGAPGERVFALGERVAASFDLATGARTLQPLPSFERRVHAVVNSSNPGEYLVLSERITTGSTEGSQVDVFVPGADGSVSGPETSRREPFQERLIGFARRPGAGHSAPLTVFGSKRVSTSYKAAILECGDDGRGCAPASYSDCNVSDGFVWGVAHTEAGATVAQTSHTLYSRTRNGNYECRAFEQPVPWMSGGGEPVPLASLESIGRAGDRAFVCAHYRAPACQPSHAVVLTATIGLDRAPDWRVMYEAEDYAYCREFIGLPGRTDRVRLFLTNGKFLELEPGAATVGQQNIRTVYLPEGAPGYHTWRTLESGATIMTGAENTIYVTTSTRTMQPLYTPARRVDRTFDAIVAVEDGFLVFDDPSGITHVRREGGAISTLPWGEALAGNVGFREAVVDTLASNADEVVVVLAGYQDGSSGRPLIRRLFLSRAGGQLALRAVDTARFETVQGTEPDSGTLVAITQDGPGHFVALDDRTRIWSGDGRLMREVKFDYDDPTTPEQEDEPINSMPACGGSPPPLNDWRAIHGGFGVAWAVGARGLVVRVVGDRAQRFVPRSRIPMGSIAPTRDSEITAVWATCPDQVLFGGVLTNVELAATARIWQLAPEDSTRTCPSSVPGEGSGSGTSLLVHEVDDTCVAYPSQIGEYAYAKAESLVPDGDSFATIFGNGHIFRFKGRQGEALKVPFEVRGVRPGPQGSLLFGGEQAALLLATPR